MRNNIKYPGKETVYLHVYETEFYAEDNRYFAEPDGAMLRWSVNKVIVENKDFYVIAYCTHTSAHGVIPSARLTEFANYWIRGDIKIVTIDFSVW